MNTEEMEVVETTETESESGGIHWDDDFDDIDIDEDVAPAEESDTDIIEEDQPDESDEDTPEADEAEEKTGEDSKEQPEEKHQFLTLKHLDESKDIDLETESGKAELTTLAQKGMDYDRIRSERDTLKAERETLATYESFLKDLAETAGMSVEDLMIDTKARLVKEDENKKGYDITLEQAKYRVQSEMKAAKKAREAEKSAVEPTPEEAPKQNNGTDVKALRMANLDRFLKAYPDVKPDDIPKEVWNEFGDGTKAEMSDLFAKYQNKKLKAEIEELKKQVKPKPRSTGSRHSNGSPEVDHDFDGFGYYDN